MRRHMLFTVLLATLIVLSGSTALAEIRVAPTPTPTAAVEEEPAALTPTPAALTPTPEALTPTPAALTPTPEALTPTPAEAAPAAAAATGVEVTVYSQNLGLIKEVRTLELEQGINEVRFSAVAAAIDPTSVHFQSLTAPDDTLVLEQNYAYDLVGSARLLSKYIDREITLITEQGQTYTGTLLSAADDIILATADGIKIVRTDKVLEYGFPTLPEGLITRPTLIWLLQAAAAGPQDVRVTYLTNDINWQADYVAVLAPDDSAVALTGWVTVDNRSGASYADARLKLVAGDIHRAAPQERKAYELEMLGGAAAPQVQERAFFEYHLYEVQRPVTLADQQTKQIEFAATPQVAVQKVFVLPGGGYPWLGSPYTDPADPNAGAVNAQVQLRLVNDEPSGLGMPLPQGRVRVYKADVDGGAELVGEDGIEHTARNEKVSLVLGSAFDVVGERVQTEYRQVDKRAASETIQVTVRNHKDEDIEVHVLEHLYRALDATVRDASAPFTQVDAQTIEFVVAAPADGEAAITYTVDYRW
ncbi:MAG: DUF4139 domain-containing protein [Anaerolineae bacterium]|jgi:hypothetical protein